MLIIKIILSVVFFMLGGLHFYWGLGGKWAAGAVLPANENNQKMLNPSALACFVVGFLLCAVGLFYLQLPFLISWLPLWLLGYGYWALALVFGLRAMGDFKYVGFFKSIKNTKFANLDTSYYSPFCVLVSLLTLVLIFNEAG